MEVEICSILGINPNSKIWTIYIIPFFFRVPGTDLVRVMNWLFQNLQVSNQWVVRKMVSIEHLKRIQRPFVLNLNSNVLILRYTFVGIDQPPYPWLNITVRYVISYLVIYYENSNPQMVGKSYGSFLPILVCFSSKHSKMIFR